MDALLNTMIWGFPGLFVAFLMLTSDESKGENYKGKYWMKNRGCRLGLVFTVSLVLAGPLALLVGIVVIADYCHKEQ